MTLKIKHIIVILLYLTLVVFVTFIGYAQTNKYVIDFKRSNNSQINGVGCLSEQKDLNNRPIKFCVAAT